MLSKIKPDKKKTKYYFLSCTGFKFKYMYVRKADEKLSGEKENQWGGDKEHWTKTHTYENVIR